MGLFLLSSRGYPAYQVGAHTQLRSASLYLRGAGWKVPLPQPDGGARTSQSGAPELGRGGQWLRPGTRRTARKGRRNTGRKGAGCARGPPPQGTCAPLCTRALPAPGSGGRRAQLWAGRGRCVRERAVGGGPSAELLQPRNRHRGPPCPGAVHAVQQPTGTAREGKRGAAAARRGRTGRRGPEKKNASRGGASAVGVARGAGARFPRRCPGRGRAPLLKPRVARGADPSLRSPAYVWRGKLPPRGRGSEGLGRRGVAAL